MAILLSGNLWRIHMHHRKIKATGIRWLSSLIRQWIPVIFKGSVINNVSLSASNLIINHKNYESYYNHSSLISLLWFLGNIYPAIYYYHDSIGSFIIRTGCPVELLGDYTGKFLLFYIKKWCFQQSIQNKRTSILHWARSPFYKTWHLLIIIEISQFQLYYEKRTQSYAENE